MSYSREDKARQNQMTVDAVTLKFGMQTLPPLLMRMLKHSFVSIIQLRVTYLYNLETAVHELRNVDGEDYKLLKNCFCEPLRDFLGQAVWNLVVVLSLTPAHTTCGGRNHNPNCLHGPRENEYRFLHTQRHPHQPPLNNSFDWMLQNLTFGVDNNWIDFTFFTEKPTPKDLETWKDLKENRISLNAEVKSLFQELTEWKIPDVTCYADVRNQSKCTDGRKYAEMKPVDEDSNVDCGKEKYRRICSEKEEAPAFMTPIEQNESNLGFNPSTSEGTASLTSTTVGRTPASTSKRLFPELKFRDTPTTDKSSSGLSPLVIGVVVGILLLILLVLGFVFIMRWKKKGKGRKKERPESEWDLRTLSIESLKSYQPSVGLGSSTRAPITYETPGSQKSEPLSQKENPPLMPTTVTDPKKSLDHPASGSQEKKTTPDGKVEPESPSSRTHISSTDLQQERNDTKDPAGVGDDTDGTESRT